uniref:Ig-like domain-containing protein n=1 Tax=Sinocyclocheilus grahami TaxID=75366 RepID=A0A672Q022_SINGR
GGSSYMCVSHMFLLLTGLVAGDSIEPDKGTEKTSKETETVKLSCSCSTSSEYVRLYWYRQYHNREPQFLLYKNERSDYEDTSDDRFHSAASRTSTELTITDVRLSDSALYYCALRVAAQ